MNTDNFWDDEKVNEFVNLRIHDGNPTAETGMLNHVNKYRMEQFKQSKTIPKKEYEVLSFKFLPISGEKDIIIYQGSPHWDKALNNTENEWSTHSVKRLSDGEVFSIGDKIFYSSCLKKNPIEWLIDNFYVTEHGTMLARSKNNEMVEFLEQIKKVEDKVPILTESKGCNICGGSLVEIRGRYPQQEPRIVCPTCTTERLEQIQELSNPNYGKTYQSK